MIKPLDLTKPVKLLSDNFEVRIFYHDGGGDFPIMGMWRLRGKEKWESGRWSLYGAYSTHGTHGVYSASYYERLFLVNVPQKKMLHFFNNVYLEGDRLKLYGAGYRTKEQADAGRGANCFACIELNLTIEEGEGL